MILFSQIVIAYLKLRRGVFFSSSYFSSIRVVSLMSAVLLIGLNSCTHERAINDEDIDIDTDGDGILDSEEIANGTNKNDPCDPVQNADYTAYDALNIFWTTSDCDNDGISNSDELANATNPYFDEGSVNDLDFAVPEFLPKLSELRIFQGDLSNLEFNNEVYEYEMSTPLFTDYSYKLRSIALPKGEQMTYQGEGLLLFPDNTVLSKTFYYLNDERNPALGKKIIETRILIKKNGTWMVGNYLWNAEQTDALLDEDAHIIPVDYIDDQGTNRMFNYKVPPKQLCFQCHDKNGSTIPVGPKARALNFSFKGKNQLQHFVDMQLLQGAPDVSQIPVLPDWSDDTISLDDRARAYLDVNCAHCHQPGGSYNLSFGDDFEFRYESSFEDTNIFETRVAIQGRMTTQISGYFMPLIGTTVIHAEGVELIEEYISSLE
ncbi:hypothetical protein [Muriicola sp. Z0-33]|uniref:hypothetical protein n=1 Tax=Muriicola sp. Z0-33 TaxID=2816957 RepID=UPI0022385DAD|nr:hypothetical protein [Muriicola sp. Z0-33]MCW5517233.1 hypothetical protein [Muriicola sp. Z0-33]